MRTILVATDFSPAAVNAANYAADMALAINAALLLLHVYSLPVIYAEVPIATTEEDMKQDAVTDIIQQKGELLKRTEGKLTIQTEVRLGTFFHELKSASERVQPYAVVLGSQGTTAAQRLFFGGHTVYAMKHLMWPVITVPPEAIFSAIKKIGLACDLNRVIDNTPVDEIKTLINEFNAELHILNTGKREAYNPDMVHESAVLQEMLKGIKLNYHFISNGSTDNGIIEFAEKNNIDLLVVLPKRHGLLEKLFHKSHSKQFVLHSHVPVLALHH